MPRVIAARRRLGGRGGGSGRGRGGGGGGDAVIREAEEREGVEALAAEGALPQRHLRVESGEGRNRWSATLAAGS
jgi:hypothetical protein